MAVVSAFGSVLRLGSSLSGIGSAIGIKRSKDPGRLAANARALDQIMRGGANLTFEDQGVPPLQFLLMKSPTKYGGQGGWATSKAQEDAYAKYQQAKAFLANQNSATTTTSMGGTYGIGQSGSHTGTATPLTGTVASPGALGAKTQGYVIVGLAILAALMLVRKR